MKKQLKLWYWRNIGCKMLGHRLLHSPAFCTRCHITAGYYPVEYIKKSRDKRWPELSAEDQDKVLKGIKIDPKPVEYYKKEFLWITETEMEVQKWLQIVEDDYILVMPDFDDRPHADISAEEAKELIKLDKEVKLDLAYINCPCKPKINWEGEKPIIIHNSFIDQKRVDESMGSLSTGA